MGWRLARSLEVLRTEVNTIAPKRSKISDGTIGDAAHQARCSGHNPNAKNVVCAMDITNDPTGGCAIHDIARKIARKPHPNLNYIISNGQVARRKDGFTWRVYLGTNPHTKHAHFSVGVGSECPPGAQPPYDDTSPWGLLAPVPGPIPTPTPTEDELFNSILQRIDYLYMTHAEREPDNDGKAHWYNRYIAAEQSTNVAGRPMLVFAVDQDLIASLKSEP